MTEYKIVLRISVRLYKITMNRFKKIVASFIIMTVGIGTPVYYVSMKENKK